MYRNKFSGQDNLSLGTYQVHPAILLVSPVLRVEPTIPYQQANPWILPHLQNLLQKYRKFLVWNEAYEQFDVSLFKKEREKDGEGMVSSHKQKNSRDECLCCGPWPNALVSLGSFSRPAVQGLPSSAESESEQPEKMCKYRKNCNKLS